MTAGVEPNHVVSGGRGFVMVPLDVLGVLDDPVTLAVYIRLRQHADRHGTGAHPSRQRLAGMIGHSTPKGVDKAIGRLVALGLVDVFQRWRMPDGTVVFEQREGAAQSSNGYIVYDVPGTGQGGGTVPAPEEVRDADDSGVAAPSPVGNPPLPHRGHPPYPTGDTPRTPQGILTKSLKLDPSNYPPLPPVAEGDEVVGSGAGDGGIDSQTRGGGSPDADAPGDPFVAATRIVDEWERGRNSRRGLSASWRKQLAGHVRDGVARGVPREVLFAALRAWDDGSSLSPGRLPHLIGAEGRKRSAASSSAASSRADAERTARMLDEMNAGRVEPGSVDTREYMRRALSPEAFARWEARRRAGGGAPPEGGSN